MATAASLKIPNLKSRQTAKSIFLVARVNDSLTRISDFKMGNHHSNDKSSSVVSTSVSDAKPATAAATTTKIITDGSFKSRRRSHNRKSKSKESPNKGDQPANAHRLAFFRFELVYSANWHVIQFFLSFFGLLQSANGLHIYSAY
jgi:hypothetical protein